MDYVHKEQSLVKREKTFKIIRECDVKMRLENIDVVKRHNTKSVSEDDIKDFFDRIEVELDDNIGKKIVIVTKDDLKGCKSFTMLYNIVKKHFKTKRLSDTELAIVKVKMSEEVKIDEPNMEIKKVK